MFVKRLRAIFIDRALYKYCIIICNFQGFSPISLAIKSSSNSRIAILNHISALFSQGAYTMTDTNFKADEMKIQGY